MDTVSELIAERGSSLLELLETLVKEHSSLHQWNPPNSNIFSTSGDHSFQELDLEGKRAQSRLLEEYRRFSETVRALLREQPDQALKKDKKHRDRVLAAIEQKGSTWHRTTEEVWQEASKALQAQMALIHGLYSASAEGEVIVVPDTNALLFNPNLEDWVFEEAARFEICLVPAVLGELDSLKVNHRNEGVREKAEGLIRRVKGYRDRGSLAEGVTLKKNGISLRSIALEPDLSVSLPWLDPTNSDDRLVATALEVMRRHPRSPVALVTRDINLQNKLEFARFPFLEPPLPPS